MAGSESVGPLAGRRSQDNHSAMSRAQAARAQAVVVAERTAATEEQIAVTLTRLADRYPCDAGRLRAASESAGQRAASKRQWARDHRVTAPHPVTARAPSPSRGPSPPGTGPVMTTAMSRLEALQETTLAAERDRIAAELQDRITRRIFAASLALQSAAGLTGQPSVRRRIDGATAELDQVLREIREAVFGLSPGAARAHSPAAERPVGRLNSRKSQTRDLGPWIAGRPFA
jgi:signal transduction histidine kinase